MTKTWIIQTLAKYKSLDRTGETEEERLKRYATVNYLLGYVDGKGWNLWELEHRETARV